jgi:hypothetical protein
VNGSGEHRSSSSQQIRTAAYESVEETSTGNGPRKRIHKKAAYQSTEEDSPGYDFGTRPSKKSLTLFLRKIFP